MNLDKPNSVQITRLFSINKYICPKWKYFSSINQVYNLRKILLWISLVRHSKFKGFLITFKSIYGLGRASWYSVVVKARHWARNQETMISTIILGTKPTVWPWCSHSLSATLFRYLERRLWQTTSKKTFPRKLQGLV